MNVLLILVDDGILRERLRSALSETDIVHFEKSVDEALLRLSSIQVDAVVVGDGPRFGQRAVTQIAEAVPDTPVLALLEQTDAESLIQLYRTGARAVLDGPFSRDEFRQALEVVSAAEPMPVRRRRTALEAEIERLTEQLTVEQQRSRAKEPAVTPGHSDDMLPAPGLEELSLKETVRQLERRIIIHTLEECGYVQTHTAERLGTTRRILKYKMDQLDIPAKPDGEHRDGADDQRPATGEST